MLRNHFPTLQARTKAFSWSPHIHVLVPTFWFQGALSLGWGVREEKRGRNELLIW